MEAVAQELEIPYQGFGQTTWNRPEVRRGLEAAEVRRCVIEEDSSDQSAWARRLPAWARVELTARLKR